jgi:hypothetical protein
MCTVLLCDERYLQADSVNYFLPAFYRNKKQQKRRPIFERRFVMQKKGENMF